VRARLARFLSIGDAKTDFTVYLMILFYTLVFSFATVTRFYSLKTYAYDLGNYNQALYTTLRGYGFLYYTADLPVTGGSMMGVHFSPILLMILPIYAIYPAPPTLLALKSFVLALGALPLYQLAKYFLKTRFWGMLFSAIYLLNPALQGINWFDFHPEAFFPTLCLFSLYYGLKRDWLRYVLFSILTLTTTEYSAVLILVNSFYLLWFHKNEMKLSWRVGRHLEFRNIAAYFKYPLMTMVIAIVWFFIALQIISIFSPNPMVRGGATQWSILGADSVPSIPLQLIMAPQSTFAALLYDWPLKLTYLLLLFGSTAFLSFLSPKSLILTLPWFTIALLSNYSPFYYIGNQYPAFLVPLIMIGSVISTRRFLEFASKKPMPFDIQKMVVFFLLILSLIFSIISSPLYGMHLGTWPDLTYGFEPITEHDRIVMQVLSLIPENASVITQQNIFPLLSSRTNSFVIPIGSFYPPGKDFNTTLNEWIEQSDFVLVDLKTSVFETYLIYNLSYTHIKDFGVYASNDGVILLKNKYSDEPFLFVPYNASFNWDDLWLLPRGEVQEDLNSDSRKVFLHRANRAPLNDFWHGPGVYLCPGEYLATFKLKVSDNSPSHIVTISASSYPFELKIEKSGSEEGGSKFFFLLLTSNSTSVYASRILFGTDFAKTNVYEEFNLTFSLSLPAALEFSGTDVSPNTHLYLDWINVTQLSALP